MHIVKDYTARGFIVLLLAPSNSTIEVTLAFIFFFLQPGGASDNDKKRLMFLRDLHFGFLPGTWSSHIIRIMNLQFFSHIFCVFFRGLQSKDFRASGLGQVRHLTTATTATAAITLARLFIEMLCSL